MSASRKFMKHWFAIEAIPLYAIIGLAVGGAGWYVTRLARGPTVVWTRSNPEPWNSVNPKESTKMVNMNPNLDKSWSRGKL